MLDMLLAWVLSGLKVYVDHSPDSPGFIIVRRILIVMAVLWVVGLIAFVLLVRRFTRYTGNVGRPMQFYWSYRTIPELASLPKARQQEIWEQCRALSRARSRTRFARIPLHLIVWFATGMLGCAVSDFVPVTFLHGNPGVCGLLVLALVCAVLNHFRIVRLLPEIRKRVGGLCLTCGYDLRASPGRCPECGTHEAGTERGMRRGRR